MVSENRCHYGQNSSTTFGKIRRGRLDENVVPFSGDFAALEKYVPEKLSLRQVTSKTASVFDLRGSLAPITGHMRLDIRRVVKATSGWDDPMPPEVGAAEGVGFPQAKDARGCSQY